MRSARWILLSLFVSTASLHAHALHQSHTEAEYNPQTKKLEVSLTVFINDLEVALIRQAERELSLTKTPAEEVDVELQRFLTKHFVVTDPSKRVASIEWVGRQMEAATEASGDPEVTLFFQVPLPNGLNGATLKHTVFCDHFADQMNLLHLRSGTQSTELRFTKNDKAKALTLPK